MNWIKQNTFLAGLLAVVIIGAAVLGFFFMQARGQYTEAQSRLDAAFAAKSSLEKQVPFPDEANAAELRSLVSNFRTTSELFTSKMLQAQAQMPAGVRVARFQEDLALNVDAVVKAAEVNGVTLPEGFYLGMDKYRSQVPAEDAVDRLQFQLNATVRLANLLFANGVTKMGLRRESFETAEDNVRSAARSTARGTQGRGRDDRPERDEDKTPEVSEAYPMEVVFEISPRGFQNVLNALSNTAEALGQAESLDVAERPGEYYFVTRWMRVENAVMTGPERSDPAEETADTVDVPEPSSDEPFAESAAQDLNMVFGTENVKAYLALDLVRFLGAKPDVTASN